MKSTKMDTSKMPKCAKCGLPLLIHYNKECPPMRSQTKEQWAFSILSDAQELLSMKFFNEANEKINNAKKVLRGQYKEIENGFAIRVI